MKYTKIFKLITCYTILCAGILIPYSAHAVVFSAIIAFYKTLLGETHALAISIKQNAVSANQIVRMTNQSNKTLSEAIKVIKQSERLAKTLVDYGAKTGQPFSTQCSSLLDTKAIAAKYEISINDTFMDMQNYAQKITMGNTGSKLNQASLHSSQSDLNNIKDTKDVTFADTFSKDNLDNEQMKAANAYTQKIIQPKIDQNSQCKSLGCSSSAGAELQYNAALSIASYSLNGQINQRKISLSSSSK